MSELVTPQEALNRVGLGELLGPGRYDSLLIEWSGYPKAFACGHTATRGFGPLRDGVENNAAGSGRLYQETVRVSQHFCSGAVLFCWNVYSKNGNQLNSCMIVSIDRTLDGGGDTVLKVCFSA